MPSEHTSQFRSGWTIPGSQQNEGEAWRISISYRLLVYIYIYTHQGGRLPVYTCKHQGRCLLVYIYIYIYIYIHQGGRLLVYINTPRGCLLVYIVLKCTCHQQPTALEHTMTYPNTSLQHRKNEAQRWQWHPSTPSGGQAICDQPENGDQPLPIKIIRTA